MTNSQVGQYTILHTIRSLRVDGVVKVVLRNMGRRDVRNFRHYVCSMLPDDPINGELAAEFRAVGIDPIFLGHRGPAATASSVAKLARLMRELDVDLVHANRTLDLALAGTAARLRGIPVVSSLHWLGQVSDHPEDAGGSWLPRHSEMMAPVLLNRVLASRIVAVSGAVKRSFDALPGFPASRIQVVFPGIDMASGRVDPAERDRLRRELELDGAGPVLLNVGRLEPVKGQLNLIPMMRLVREEFPDAVLLIAGEGDLRGALESAIAAAGLSGRVRLLGTRSDVDALLCLSEVLVMSSESEAAPLPLFEAMRASRAIVATDVGGVSEILGNSGAGRVVARGDPRALAHGVLDLLRTPGAAERAGRTGHAIARERFDLNVSVRALEEMYLELLA